MIIGVHRYFFIARQTRTLWIHNIALRLRTVVVYNIDSKISIGSIDANDMGHYVCCV